tara:strand:- start:429 stop:659 length:231 start_codon:yes stop_codon:yes gene_type:complete
MIIFKCREMAMLKHIGNGEREREGENKRQCRNRKRKQITTNHLLSMVMTIMPDYVVTKTKQARKKGGYYKYATSIR